MVPFIDHLRSPWRGKRAKGRSRGGKEKRIFGGVFFIEMSASGVRRGVAPLSTHFSLIRVLPSAPMGVVGEQLPRSYAGGWSIREARTTEINPLMKIRTRGATFSLEIYWSPVRSLNALTSLPSEASYPSSLPSSEL